MDNITMLTGFGLTRQEAQIYSELLNGGRMTGYEVSKRLGIPRSNVYTSLSGLVEKNAADIYVGEPSYYSAIPIRRFCQSKLCTLTAYTDELISSFSPITQSNEGAANIYGTKNITDRLGMLISESRESIRLCCPGHLFKYLSEDIERASNRRISVLTKTSGAALIAIFDQKAALMGEMTADESKPCCIYSENRLFAECALAAFSEK